MINTLFLRPSIHFTTLHPTTLQSTSLHFTQLHFTPLHYTSPNYTSLHFTQLHFTPLHYTCRHFTSSHLNFTFLLCHKISSQCVYEFALTAFLLHNSSRDNIRPAAPWDSTQPATEKQKYPLKLLYEKLSNQNEKPNLFTTFRSVNMRWYRRNHCWRSRLESQFQTLMY